MTGKRLQEKEELGLTDKVRGAVIWRSGSQIVAQLVTWAATFLVIRMLAPSDYGLFAMTQAILVLLSLMNGWGYANALVRSESISPREIRQVFGMLLLLNGGLALAQIVLAPLAAAYFRQPLVTELLRVQALIYLATPFIALGHALLGRRMDFRRPGQIHLLAALLSAATALAGAALGWGVWTLVAAPIVLFWTQAIGMAIAARLLILPSFRFAGAGHLFRYGNAMLLVQFFWFIQSQSAVFIAGRQFDTHSLGLYTTALFLTQILAAKFVPPLNEVAFAAYSRIQDKPDAVSFAFLKAVRLIMLIALPFYFGLAVTAEPLVLTMLGPKWEGTIPLVAILAWAMPFMTVQIMVAPATNAIGREDISVRTGMIGALVLPVCFLIGVGHGPFGMAVAWLVGFPILTAATFRMALPAIGTSITDLVRALAPGLAASAAMAIAVTALDHMLPAMAPQPRLALLVLAGTVFYGGLLFIFARQLVAEVVALVLRQPAALKPRTL
ncbi:lipopolysaccharide biosynthesis protein [Sphingosinicella rhizophila]|uniref:Lipopolysaccharide biosynthesis protein n=1 Tax=Sphingosinicella rhizophila TaxID=3050082 RepID=A0ABU3QD25_9SPHN|nr:lipopolysaccharide biosynthesis protein [Sphingosinicella sp. GR2756]MDT9600898.1 lipopolysaccharide biosynthesis protein [Sphingosinicella sp. GR2756]